MRAVRLRDDHGTFAAVIGSPGRIYTPYVRIDSPNKGPFIKKWRMANGDIDKYSEPLMRGGKDYPVKTAANHMLRIGRKSGITKGARQLLNEARA